MTDFEVAIEPVTVNVLDWAAAIQKSLAMDVRPTECHWYFYRASICKQNRSATNSLLIKCAGAFLGKASPRQDLPTEILQF